MPGPNSVVPLSENRFALATRVGTVKTMTLALALRSSGFMVETHDGFLTISSKDGAHDLNDTLLRIATGEPVSLFGEQTNLIFEKFHPYLTRDLLEMDALGAKVDRAALAGLCDQIGKQ